MDSYTPPQVRELGTLSQQTLETINKNSGSSDVIVIGGQSTPAPGSGIRH